MSKRRDLTGLITAGHTVVSLNTPAKRGASIWNCACNLCGRIYTTRQQYAAGDRPCPPCARIQAGNARQKHGLTALGVRNPIYNIWTAAKQRCTNQEHAMYHHYGGRGVRMHEPWVTDVAAFVEYVSSLPHYGEDGRTLDRINNDGNYEPGNLRWATQRDQMSNTRQNRYITHNGETRTVSEWAKLTGLGQTFVSRFYKLGATGDKLFNPAKQLQQRGKLYAHNGELRTLMEWAATLNVPYKTLHTRVTHGKPLTKGVTP